MNFNKSIEDEENLDNLHEMDLFTRGLRKRIKKQYEKLKLKKPWIKSTTFSDIESE